MSFKLNHYARPVNTNVKSTVEASLIELSIGLLCAVFAYSTYNELLVLFVSTTIVATICFLLTLHNCYLLIMYYFQNRKSS